MLPKANSYSELVQRFRWQVPDDYNIGFDVCDKWADVEPERPALLHKANDGAVQTFTFGDMKRLSNQTANLLQAHGVEQGDRVGVLLPQSPETGYVHG